MDKCNNFEDEEGKCVYYGMLQGTDEELPTGVDSDTGVCLVIQNIESWIEAEVEDCDMLDLVEDGDDT